MLLSGAGAIALDLLVQKLIVPGLSHCWLRPSKVLYLSLAQTSFLLELSLQLTALLHVGVAREGPLILKLFGA